MREGGRADNGCSVNWACTGPLSCLCSFLAPVPLPRGARPEITSAPSWAAYGAPITIISPQATSVTAVAIIRTGAVTHAFNMDQRYVELLITSSSGNNLTVQIPPDARVAPPGYYLLFILQNGVPSPATFIRLG